MVGGGTAEVRACPCSSGRTKSEQFGLAYHQPRRRFLGIRAGTRVGRAVGARFFACQPVHFSRRVQSSVAFERIDEASSRAIPAGVVFKFQFPPYGVTPATR